MSAPVAAQIVRLQEEMASRPAGLIAHVERVVAESRRLAESWLVDPERIELAAWGHDLFRSHPREEQLRLAEEAGVPVGAPERREPVFLHGPIAAVVLQERFAVSDAEALAAVREHTTGAAEMSLLAKVLLVADKVEPGKRRNVAALQQIRRLAYRDIDLALLCWADWKLVREKERSWLTHPAHWRARRRWVAEHHLDLGWPPGGQEA